MILNNESTDVIFEERKEGKGSLCGLLDLDRE